MLVENRSPTKRSINSIFAARSVSGPFFELKSLHAGPFFLDMDAFWAGRSP